MIIKKLIKLIRRIIIDLEMKREMRYQIDPDEEYFADEDPNDWQGWDD